MPILNISPNFWQIFPCKELAEVYFYLRSIRGTEFGFFKQNIGCVMDKQENPWELAGCIWRNLFTRISKNLERLLGKVRDGIFIYKSCSTWPLSCGFQKWKLTKEFGAKLLLVLSQMFLEWGGDMLSLLFTTCTFFVEEASGQNQDLTNAMKGFIFLASLWCWITLQLFPIESIQNAGFSEQGYIHVCSLIWNGYCRKGCCRTEAQEEKACLLKLSWRL